ncbi:hypothetical protein SALBM135S_02424 [Streptomyces alboniger]
MEGSHHEPQEHHGRPDGRRRHGDAGRVVVALVAVLTLVFIFENTRSTKIRLLIPEVTMPLWTALLATGLLGALCGAYFMGGAGDPGPRVAWPDA